MDTFTEKTALIFRKKCPLRFVDARQYVSRKTAITLMCFQFFNLFRLIKRKSDSIDIV